MTTVAAIPKKNITFDNLLTPLKQDKNNLFAMQKTLQKKWETEKSLNGVINDLYQQQIDTEYIRKDVLQYINNIFPIKAENGEILCNIQYNPARLNRGISPNPNPNPVNILPWKNIPCFCCVKNIQTQWPKERGFKFLIDEKPYVLLANPSPIFDQHFTLVSEEHKPWEMDIELLAKISDLAPNMWVIQNGNGAGASNPWHFHLQLFSGAQKFPIENIKAKTSHTKILPDTQKLLIEKLDYPMHIYRLKFDQVTPELLKYLNFMQDEYLKIDPKNRLTYMVKKNNNNQFELYFSLRHLDKKTALYSEQVGYPEPLGFLIVHLEKEKADWLLGGEKRFYQMLADAKVDEEMNKKFINVIEGII